MATMSSKPAFNVGDYVAAVSATGGWGSVSQGDIGVVTAPAFKSGLSGGQGWAYRVKFAKQDGWVCIEQDLRRATSNAAARQGFRPDRPSANVTVPPDMMSSLLPDDLIGIDKMVAYRALMGSPQAKTPVRRMPSHLKGLKPGSQVRVTQDRGDFQNGDIFIVDAIDHDDKTVRGPCERAGDRIWIDFAFITTDLEGGPGSVSFDSVILADHKKEKIMATIKQVDNYKLIFEDWGFASVLEKGKAISMLFYGPPGTGKTLMAQAIADKLHKKLKIIGSAEIESSEPGQAERNIKAFFENTKPGTILLFDECDSLVYSRENVGSILAAQVNQLLSSLETFEGIVVFTTNRLGVLDEAFNRRLSLKLEFDMPTAEERVKIWQRMFPKKAPVADDVDWQRLAEIELSGGYIKNAVLRAARMAAAEEHVKPKDKKITMRHLVDALSDEAQSVIEFEEARKHNHTPRMMGGGLTRTSGASR